MDGSGPGSSKAAPPKGPIPSQTVPLPRDQVFKELSLGKAFLIQTTTPGKKITDKENHDR